MDTLRGCAEVLLRKIPYDIAEVNISKEVFCQYATSCFPQYTDDEIAYIFEYHIKDKPLGIFDIVIEVARKLLFKSENRVSCFYSQALRWRDISFKLGQDIFVTAFLAQYDFEHKTETQDFSWFPTIPIENNNIHRILQTGLAENHFHLNGSTQIFSLSFLCIVNYIENRQKDFDQIKVYLDTNYDSSTKEYIKKSLYGKCVIAAAIRLYLFCKIHNNISIFDGHIDINRLDEIDASAIGELQHLINTVKYSHGYAQNPNYYGLCFDYAYDGTETIKNDNKALIGERIFLYKCFYEMLRNRLTDIEKKYFLQYLIIKNTFRNELVQTNCRIGFKNFSSYQDRKDIFIKGFKQYEYELVRLAINSTISNGSIKSLEARISPKNNSDKNAELINFYDKIVDSDEHPKYNHFYVFHFPKSADKCFDNPYLPRNYSSRKAAIKKARSIVAMLDINNKLRRRVHGIDACANEIGCRPEVFAHSFRYLMNTEVWKKTVADYDSSKYEKLNATYHVGEDFFDIVDGLRAIDEVITYFGFKSGNRLGHAIALGICPNDYYRKKKVQLIMTKQDELDNIAWMLEKAKIFNIKVNLDLKNRLEEIYNNLLLDIYNESNLDTYNYFQSWKLRGDAPELYLHSSETTTSLLESDNYKINNNISNSIRSIPKCRELYYKYHYNHEVKVKGNKKDVFIVDEKYIELVKSIQYEMQKLVKSLGIMIESNPSSNYLIGTIDKYEQHPIFTFFDIDSSKESNISVSINTDDQGVFETSLQMEYSLLALSLQKTQKYDEQRILRFIDEIRRCSLEQVFS